MTTLRELRQQHGLSLEEAGKRTGIPPRVISNLESGNIHRWTRLKLLADLYEVPLRDIAEFNAYCDRLPSCNVYRRKRMEAGLSVESVAEKHGITAESIINAERASAGVTMLTTYRLAKAYGCPFSELYGTEVTRLWLCRLETGKSREEVSKQSGISVSALSDFETEKRHPSPETRRKLADFYGCRPEELGDCVRRGYDYTGETMGRLQIIQEVTRQPGKGKMWLCRCRCGFYCQVTASYLQQSGDPACEVCRYLGKRQFGRLTVLSRSEEPNQGRNVRWRAKCVCGNKTVITARRLNENADPSCARCEADRMAQRIRTASANVHQYGTMAASLRNRLKGRNDGRKKTGKSGVTQLHNGAWYASITFRGEIYSLSSHKTFEAARATREQAEQLLFGGFLKWYEKAKDDERAPDFYDSIQYMIFLQWHSMLFYGEEGVSQRNKHVSVEAEERRVDRYYEDHELIAFYQDILENRRRSFPPYIWKRGDTCFYSHAAVITRYLLDDVLGWDRQQVIEHFGTSLLREYRLGGMLYQLFSNSALSVLGNAYPGMYDVKSFASTCVKELPLELEIARLRKLLEGLGHEQVVQTYNHAFLRQHKLLTKATIQHGMFKLLDMAFPGEYLEWEFVVPKNFWKSRENRQRAVRWLIDKLGKKKISIEEFAENGLGWMYENCDELKTPAGAVCEALNLTTAELAQKFHKMMKKCVSCYGIPYMSREMGRTRTAIGYWANGNRMPKCGDMLSMLDQLQELSGNASPVEVYKLLLSGDLQKFPMGFWKTDRVKKARQIVRYAVEDVMRADPLEACLQTTPEEWNAVKLQSILNKIYNHSIHNMVADAFPEMDFNWNGRPFRRRCMLWLQSRTGKQVPDFGDFAEYNMERLLVDSTPAELALEVLGLDHTDVAQSLSGFLRKCPVSVQEFARYAEQDPNDIRDLVSGVNTPSPEITLSLLEAMEAYRAEHDHSRAHALPV